MDCRIDLDPPIEYQWSKLGGLLPRDTQTLEVCVKRIYILVYICIYIYIYI